MTASVGGIAATTAGATIPTPVATTSYAAGTPTVDGVINGPWNTSQGDAAAGSPYPTSDLFPTYTPGGPTTLGGFPNLAVYPAASAATPFPSGVVGTPGPLDAYCTAGYPNNEGATPLPEPTGIDLPFAPYYFPDVVRNSDGSLTGYFDYRPKDADEELVSARSTDNGQTWTVTGEALDQNGGYCPTADANDDGEGHAYVATIAGTSRVYTLQRAAGDNTGIGLLAHAVSPAASDPLAGVPANEAVGIDPNTFATATTTVPSGSGSATIPVSTLGSAGSPEQIVAGPYEDLNAATPSASIITCTGVGTLTLTGCSVAGSSSLTVNANDDLVQVIATASPGTGKTYAIPAGPNLPTGAGGLATVSFTNATSVSPITTYILNNNAPNRVYIDGATVYCVQSNANPTTKIENCTTTKPGGLTVNQGDAITADPILPSTAKVTTGLIAPDGIVGVIPSYPGVPTGATAVLYTEKILGYYIVGTTKSSVTLPAATINMVPSVTQSEPLPTTGSFTISLGTAVGSPIQQVTCTGTSAGTGGTVNLTGCSGGTGTVAAGNWVGGPGAAVVPYSVLSQTGEGTNGASKGPEKLFGNNEDLTLLRAAYTTNGIDFTDLGAISGSTSGTGNNTGTYNDVSNPNQTTSPSTTGPTSLPAAAPDTVELRYVGSRGTIITNPDGSYGMFLSGAWATDGDSDAFNQIFYTSSTDGQHWSTPTVVLSTDYTFAASVAQQGTTNPLGVSAYYSGRAYGPSIVQNPDGTLTMVFSGYRLPKPITAAGTSLGSNPSALYTVGTTDPALYRNILTSTLTAVPGTITGTVKNAGGTGIPNICVYPYNAASGARTSDASACTNSAGVYTLSAAPGSDDLVFYDSTGAYVTQWYNGVPYQAQATPVSVASGATTSGINAVMATPAAGAEITGTVTNAGGTGIPNICVYPYVAATGVRTADPAACTDGSGNYTLSLASAGTYNVAFYDPTGTDVTQWFNDAPYEGQATPVTVVAGTPATGVNAVMSSSPVGSTEITGKVTNGGGTGIPNICVYPFNSATGNRTADPAACTDASGDYTLSVAPGSYNVVFYDPTGVEATQWYSGAQFEGGATPVVVTTGATPNINATLTP